MERYKVTGIENGAKRTLEWVEGELIGDDDLRERFQQLWESADHGKYREIHEDDDDNEWACSLAKDLLLEIFPEILACQILVQSTDEELQALADEWNSYEDNDDHHYTLEEMREFEEQDNRVGHCSPPYSWDEIEFILQKGKLKRKPLGTPPEASPKCLECLEPMEWIYFSSSAETWRALAGIEGWTPICRKCETWGACHITARS